jgi:hypothetical protein
MRVRRTRKRNVVRLSEGSMILCRLSNGERREGVLKSGQLIWVSGDESVRGPLDAGDRNIRVADPCAVARDGITGEYCDLFEHL